MADPGQKDIYAAESAFDANIKERMADLIVNRYNTPEGAALQCGVKISTYRKWYDDYELFRIFIDGCVERRNSGEREKIGNAIDEIENPKDRANVRLNFLSKMDKQFGANVNKFEDVTKENVLSPKDAEDIGQAIEDTRIVEEAEKLANRPIEEDD